MATAVERKRLSRRRKKLGKMLCRQVEVTGRRRGDQVSVSEAVSALLSDLVLEATA